MVDDHSLHHEGGQALKEDEKGPRSYSGASLVLGFLSIVFALGAIVLLPPLVVGLGILCALLGLVLGIYQIVRVRSGRIPSSAGAFFSIVGGGMSALVIIGMFAATTHVDVLLRMGYERAMIDDPILVESFEAVGQPSAQWMFSGFTAPLGWYSNGQEGTIPIRIPLTGSEPTEPVSFDPGSSIFGLFMRVDGIYEWFTEPTKNRDGKSHIKVYPVIVNGRELANSYLVFWEDYPLDGGPNRLVDFTDLILRLDGVKLVPLGGD